MPPQVRFTARALDDLKRLRKFLEGNNPLAARRVASSIKKALAGLSRNPRLGRPAAGREGWRELIIELGPAVTSRCTVKPPKKW